MNQADEIEVPLDQDAGRLILGDEGIEFQIDTDHELVVVSDGPWPDMYLWAGISRVDAGTFTPHGVPVRAVLFVSTDGAQLVLPHRQPEMVAAMCMARACPSGVEYPFWTRVHRAAREMDRRRDNGDPESGSTMSREIAAALLAVGLAGHCLVAWLIHSPEFSVFELLGAVLFGSTSVHSAFQLRGIMRELESRPVVPPGGLPSPPYGWRPDRLLSPARPATRRY